MNFSFPYIIGEIDGLPALIHVDVHTNSPGHSLVTGTLGVREVEKRLREVLDAIARDIETAVAKGALIE